MDVYSELCPSVHRSFSTKQLTLQMAFKAPTTLEVSLIIHSSTVCNQLLFLLPTAPFPFSVH